MNTTALSIGSYEKSPDNTVAPSIATLITFPPVRSGTAFRYQRLRKPKAARPTLERAAGQFEVQISSFAPLVEETKLP